MYYNPLTKEEEFHELVKEIESQSAYKRVPSPEKKYMSVAEMGRLLGLKKTDRYWLVHKNFFKTEVILGKMRVELESFEKWYANQIKYHKVTGEEPGRELKQHSYSPKDIAEILQISEWQVYEEMKKADVKYILVDYWKRYPKEAFDEWYRNQNRFRNARDREKVRDIVEGSMRMPEMARMLGVSRSVVYNIIASSDILKNIEFDGRRRVIKKSFYEWYASQDRYHIVSEQAPETVKKEDNRRIETYRRAVQDRDGHTKNIGNDAYLTVKEAALLAGINPATVHKWIKKGKIEAVQSSKTVRIPRRFVFRDRRLKIGCRAEKRRISMASIVERRGRFCVVYSYKDKNGKRRQKWETYKTMSEAKKRKKEIEYRADIGQMIVPHCKTVKELLEEYVNLYGKEA